MKRHKAIGRVNEIDGSSPLLHNLPAHKMTVFSPQLQRFLVRNFKAAAFYCVCDGLVNHYPKGLFATWLIFLTSPLFISTLAVIWYILTLSVFQEPVTLVACVTSMCHVAFGTRETY